MRSDALVRTLDPLRGKSAPKAPPSALIERIKATPRAARTQATHRPTRRLIGLAAALVGVGLLVPTVGTATGLFRLLDEEPAPPAVKRELRAPALGLVQLTTSTGDVATLYRANNDSGDCTYVRIVGSTGSGTSAPGIGVANCNPESEDPRAITRFSQTWQRVDGGSLEFALGKVMSDVASVEVVSKGGRAEPVPLSHGYFLYEVGSHEKAVAIVARNKEGAIIDRRAFENVRPPLGK
jgi:hypothetical protein